MRARADANYETFINGKLQEQLLNSEARINFNYMQTLHISLKLRLHTGWKIKFLNTCRYT